MKRDDDNGTKIIAARERSQMRNADAAGGPIRNRAPNVSLLEAILAWSVHLVTASGAVAGILALIAIVDHRWIEAFFWMAASLVIDSVDGSLARLFHVKRVLPGFDGALLDNIIDYFTYVIVPAFLLYEAALLPSSMALVGIGAIAMTSGYQFCQANAKTPDHYFVGFPSYWNIIAFYLFFLQLNVWINLLVIVVLCGLIFIPIKYVYPSRAPHFQNLTLSLAALWAAVCAVFLTQYPDYNIRLVWVSLLFGIYYIGISLYLMWRATHRNSK